jgi:hypothetical protein
MIMVNSCGFISFIISLKCSNSLKNFSLVERMFNRKIIAIQTNWDGKYV